MTAVPVQIAGELVIQLEHLESFALEQIKNALTIKNEDQVSAASRKQFGWWDMPEYVHLWRIEERRGGDNVLCMPRGFASALVAGLGGMGLTVQWDDRRSHAEAAPGYFRPFQLRDYQLDAVMDMLKHEQGFYKCPAGGGKTITSLGAMAYANQRTLVITDKAGLAEQWRSRASAEWLDSGKMIRGLGLSLDFDDERAVGKIGEDVWEERDLTICLRQTLHSRAWELDATGWWQKWGMVFFDEGHHLAADTLAEICRKITSHYLLAVSATPAKSEIRGQVVHALVGPIIHETSRQVLYDRGVLMKPKIEVLPGDFKEVFWPDHDSTIGDGHAVVCEVPGCRKSAQGQKHSHRNNYSSVLKKLVENEERNERIAAKVVSHRGHYHLIPSRQKKHLDLLRKAIVDAGWPEEKIWMLRGEENAAGLSQEIAAEVELSDEAVILSTVADEGLDIPPIDRVHLVFPGRQEGATIQVVGRGERMAPNKTDSLVIDYREPLVDVLEGQFEERMRTYRMQGYEITQTPMSYIRYWTEPEKNTSYFQHLGCASWVAPLDDCSPPSAPEECDGCAQVLPVVVVA